MKLYKLTINPQSVFGTPLKGDTFFGHICWMIAYRDEKRLDTLLQSYKDGKPFLVVSDGFYQGYLPKPKMPSKFLGEDSACKKENRKKIWLSFEDLQNGNYKKAKKEKEIAEKKDIQESVIKNSINYKTFKTDEGNFAPFAINEYLLNPKDIYLLLDESQFSLDELKDALELLSIHGYGKDTTVGKGRFEIDDLKEINLDFNAKTFMSLSPFALDSNDNIDKLYYEPFVKFGKFGGKWAYYNAFKKPILFLDTASVTSFKKRQERKFIGKAIKDISLSDDPIQQKSVQQGYSILFPLKDIS